MRFKGLDLNLLGVFDTLMRTRSVSRTAEESNLSQPAISSALKRLRVYFGDEILTAHNKRMVPTAYAESLWPQVRDSLRAIEGLIATSTRFDSATSQRTFRVGASDYMATAIFAPLSRTLAREAPGVRLELVLNDEHSFTQLEQGALDLLVTPEGYMARGMPAEHLLDERHVVVGCRTNPLLAAPLDEAGFLSVGHVEVAIGPSRTPVFGDRELARMGKCRSIEIIVSSFAVVPWLVVKTSRLALMHERLALVMAEIHPIAIAEVPFAFPKMREMIQYHPAKVDDPGLTWFRERLRTETAIDRFL